MKQENKKKILSVFWEAAGLFPDCLGSIHTRKAVTGDRNDKTLPQIMTELLQDGSLGLCRDKPRI